MKSKRFINKLQYPGGKEALEIFVKNNLRYPKDAILNKIEGKVFIKYEVNDIGVIHSVTVTSGIGYGCDKEAIRIVKLLQYPSKINKGVRTNTKLKISIDFQLPRDKTLSINYIYKKKD